ncbi:Adenylosuccinate lyase [Anopheles sinensis]|uniref:Adenylosuccinate lyase n=1 Tax=Anopheles sinensis TaxID=74873 RepID=A0A084WH94_ANOSI|nr:Adenylosuccinate lyase [Anopheles sinensis]
MWANNSELDEAASQSSASGSECDRDPRRSDPKVDSSWNVLSDPASMLSIRIQDQDTSHELFKRGERADRSGLGGKCPIYRRKISANPRRASKRVEPRRC